MRWADGGVLVHILVVEADQCSSSNTLTALSIDPVQFHRRHGCSKLMFFPPYMATGMTILWCRGPTGKRQLHAAERTLKILKKGSVLTMKEETSLGPSLESGRRGVMAMWHDGGNHRLQKGLETTTSQHSILPFGRTMPIFLR